MFFLIQHILLQLFLINGLVYVIEFLYHLLVHVPSKIFGVVSGGAHIDTLLEVGSCHFQGPHCGKGNHNLLLITVQGLEKKWPI